MTAAHCQEGSFSLNKSAEARIEVRSVSIVAVHGFGEKPNFAQPYSARYSESGEKPHFPTATIG